MCRERERESRILFLFPNSETCVSETIGHGCQ